jgi:glycosyltransferase involved in cell wall biosynthesis
MNHRRPLVSIITPSYNQAEFIEQTMLSVLEQDYPLLEYIIVDGGSTDESPELIESYADRYPGKIRWLSEQDGGQADAINKGFRMASGQIIAWLNSDDTYLYRSTLSEVVSAFKQMPEADVIYGDAVLISEDSSVLKVLCSPPFRDDWLMRSCRITQPAAFFRRQVIESEQLDASISIVLDYDYWLRLRKDFVFKHVPGLWATDRNQRSRKILAQRPELIRQSAAIKQRYGQKIDLRYGWYRMIDKLRYGFTGKIKGLLRLPELYRQKSALFAVPLRFDPFWKTVWRQLWKNNRDLS